MAQRRQQSQRFSYRPLLGQGEAHRFGEAARVDATPTLAHCDAASAGAALAAWAAAAAPAAPRCGLIDLRTEAAFTAAHLAGSTSLPWGGDLAGAAFIARAHELPERGASLALLADGAEVAAAAADHLSRAGYAVPFTVALPAALLAATAWAASPAAGLASSVELWHPSPCLQELIEAIALQLGSSGSSGSSNTVLDLGCGTGRDCIFLAKRGGFTVTGIDYLEKQLVRARDIASRSGVAQSCTFLQLDVCAAEPATWLPAQPADVRL